MDVQQLLNGRTAGVAVIQGAGITGQAPTIRIRGVNSMSLRNDPLVIVDGIRVETGSETNSLTTASTSRLSAFNENEIESIDVIKGPSAAAMYGTAAANGVLVIKTKRGREGPTKWLAYASGGTVSQPAEWQDNYRSWGRNIDPRTRQPTSTVVQCRIQQAALGSCLVDSLTTFNPLRHPETTPYQDQPRYNYGLQASGGSRLLNFFVAGEIENETGPFEMPAGEIQRLTEQRGSRPLEEQIHPNRLRQYNLRGNVGIELAPNANVNVSAGYIDRRLRVPFEASYFQGLTFQTTQAPGYRTPKNGNSLQYTGDIFSVTQEQEDKRFTGSLSTTYNPKSWLTLRGVGGIDQSAGFAYTLQRTGEGVVTGWGNLVAQNGGKQQRREVAVRYSADLGATAMLNYSSSLNFRTSVGAQYFNDLLEATFADGFDLLPGSTTLTAAGRRTAGESTVENATYGAFIEEVVGWRDRLFLSGALRTDKNSAFGFRQGSAVYPRASLSWVASEESFFPARDVFDDVRLRLAWGKAGVQPSTTAALAFYTGALVPIGVVNVPALSLAALGNSALEPETTAETEFGADIGLFDGRVTIEATWFNKDSKNALISVALPPSVAAGFSQFQNLGKVRNRGYELGVSIDPIRTSNLSWTVRFTGSKVDNKVISIGNVPISPNQGARQVPGYPISGLWARPILSWNDANQDGILTESEISVGDSLAFIGPQIPPREGTLTNFANLWNGQVRLTAQIDYKGGHYSQWFMEQNRCSAALNCRAVNDPKASLEEQAAAVATASSRFGRTNWGYYQKKDYIRLREVAITLAAPARLAALMRAQDVSITLSGRNLGLLWTNYPGLDPENNYTAPSSGAVLDYDWFTQPPNRYWLARINIEM
jgi:TonB-dependent SusC/RagA subfamily outer membrane receptor